MLYIHFINKGQDESADAAEHPARQKRSAFVLETSHFYIKMTVN